MVFSVVKEVKIGELFPFSIPLLDFSVVFFFTVRISVLAQEMFYDLMKI